jgi:hypothetical protein
LQVDSEGLRWLGNAHFAALQATFGDWIIQESDHWRGRKRLPGSNSQPRRANSGTTAPALAADAAEARTSPAQLRMTFRSAKNVSTLKRLQQTRNVYFAAARCHAMNVTL